MLKIKSGLHQRRAGRSDFDPVWRLASLAVIIMLLIVTGAPAQRKKKAARPTLKRRPAAVVTQTDVDARNSEFMRPRRTSAPTAAATAESPAPAPPATATPAEPAAAAAVTTVAPEVREEEEIAGLRDEVAVATDDRERARLQRKLIDRLVELNRTDEALRELRAVTKEERLDPIGFYNAGNTLARLGDAETAVEAYRKAIAQRRGNYSRAQNNLGVVLIRLGRLIEAADALDAALQQENNSYAEASYNRGRVHALRDELPLAIKSWERAIKLQPDHAPAVVALAKGYAQKGDAERGLEVIDAFSKRMTVSGKDVPREVTAARGEVIALGNLATK